MEDLVVRGRLSLLDNRWPPAFYLWRSISRAVCTETVCRKTAAQFVFTLPQNTLSLVREQSIVLSMCRLCMSVWLRGYLKNRMCKPPNFLSMLLLSVSRSFCGGVTVHYVRLVLWMMSCLHVRVSSGQHENGMYSKWLTRGWHWSRV